MSKSNSPILSIILDPDGDVTLSLSKQPSPAQRDASIKTADQQAPQPATSTSYITVLCSSKHLMLSSPVFQAMLKKNFKEGRELSEKGSVTIHLPDDDFTALTLILRVIHGKTGEFSRNIALDVLACVAVLTDKYQLVGTMQFFAEIWIESLRGSVPECLDQPKLAKQVPNVILWLTISWVFKQKNEFIAMTRILERESRHDTLGTEGLLRERMLDLPIPESIIDKIKGYRSEAMASIFELLKDSVDVLQSVAGCCPNRQRKHSCDGMMLGTLLKSAAEAGLWPIPEDVQQFPSSCNDIQAKIQDFHIDSDCGPDFTGRRDHSKKDMIVDSVAKLMAKLNGLNLNLTSVAPVYEGKRLSYESGNLFGQRRYSIFENSQQGVDSLFGR